MSTEAPGILLSHYLKTLKLPTFQREYQKLARLCANEGVDHVGCLARLAEREMIERDRRKVERRIKAVRFPVIKSFDSFDFITSNLPFDEWTETLGSERLTGTLLDRITHHVNILEMNGESYRLAQSRSQKTR